VLPSWSAWVAKRTAQDPSAWQAWSPCWHPSRHRPAVDWNLAPARLWGRRLEAARSGGSGEDSERPGLPVPPDHPRPSAPQKRCSAKVERWASSWASLPIRIKFETGKAPDGPGHDRALVAQLARPWRADGRQPGRAPVDANGGLGPGSPPVTDSLAAEQGWWPGGAAAAPPWPIRS